MRSEQEMLELIVSTAQDDERIRAVIMNGSRVNPDARRDIFQDFDIIYIVNDVASFTGDPNWISRFGVLMILQLPDDMDDPPPADGHFGYLMQFADGNRIDLTLHTPASLAELAKDSLSRVLLDKDRVVPPLAAPSEASNLPKPPTPKAFFNCCNEFWWVAPYVAKGLWRDEIIYAKTTLDWIVRAQLMKMLTWYIGMNTGFSINPGKFGKHFRGLLDPELWEMLEKTYADASADRNWEALFTMCELFRRTATAVADHFGFDYPAGDDERVSAHLRHVRALPKDAKQIY
jgi:aminoglycoside 6-adenylyltransferase